MNSFRFICATAAMLMVASAPKVYAERVVLTEHFGTSASTVDTSTWQATQAGMPRIQWRDENPKDAHAAGDQERQFVTTSEYGPAPVSVEFELSVWNVGKAGYNLFGFVTPDSIWKSQNGIAWKISSENGKVYAQPYTTCHEGTVPGWHERYRGKIEIPGHARLRIEWKPGVYGAFYLNDGLKDIMTVDIASMPLRFGTDVQSTSWAIDDVKISLLEPHEVEAMQARIEEAAANEFPNLCNSIGFDSKKEGAFYFIHITDTHIVESGVPAWGWPIHIENFRHCIKEISKLKPKPSFIVITGDLTAEGGDKQWQAFHQLVKEMEQSADVPVHMTLGNHDLHPEIFLRLFADRKLYYSFDLGAVRFIALHPYPDSSEPKDALSTCCLGPEQGSWFADRLAQFTGKTVVVFVHHPLLSGDFTTNDLLLDIQSSLRHIKAGTEIWAVSGHRHCDGLFQVLWGGHRPACSLTTPALCQSVTFRCFFVQDGRILKTATKSMDSPMRIDPPPAAWEEHTLFYPPEHPMLQFVNVPNDDKYMIDAKNCATTRAWRDVRGADAALAYRVPLPEGATHLGAYAIWEYQIEFSADGKEWQKMTSSSDPERPYECKMPQDWGRYYKLAIPIPEDLVEGRTLFIRFGDPTPGDKHWLGMESAVDWFCLLGTR